MADPDTFTPSDATRAALRSLHAELAMEAETKFFEVWESEISNPDAPLRAGSVVAAAYMRNAARFAVFGAQCAGHEPRLEQWLALARENFEKAIEDCAEAERLARTYTR